RSARFSVATFLLISFVIAEAYAQEPPPAPGPQLQVTVNRVMVGVTVTDSAGHFISGLQRDAFRLFDNEVEKPVVDFLPVEEPAQFLLLIESGPAVLLFAKDHVLAADRLLGSVAADDRVALATYTRGPELLVDLTTNKLLARMALG